jgi:hypothetical protein
MSRIYFVDLIIRSYFLISRNRARLNSPDVETRFLVSLLNMPSPLSREELTALITDLQELLARIQTGEFEAGSGMLLRIEGAVAALQIVQGDADHSDLV